MNLCIHCKHMSRSSVSHAAVCENPKFEKGRSPVDGSPVRNWCDAMRIATCGPEASGFEPKDHQPVDRVCPCCGKKHTGSSKLCAECGRLP
jgi:hypothetical protein